jgi:mono/diheme cytochrome c family protein
MAAAMMFAGSLAVAAAQRPTTVLDGVYTTAQAGRGEAAYVTYCTACHEGLDTDGPELKGTPFLDRWREDSLESLYSFITTNMPGNRPGGLGEATYADLMAFILQSNGFPAGATELTADAAPGILLVGPEGPRPLPNLTVVRVVGCLTAGSGSTWTLTRATTLVPERGRNIEAATPAELTRSAAQPFGVSTFALRNVAEGTPLAGHKVQVKGVLNRQNQQERINVMSLDSVAPSCSVQAP